MSSEDLEYIESVGAPVLESQQFKQSLEQRHHFNCSVGLHMLHTAYWAYRVCRWLNMIGVETATNELILSCLCHDLGIVGNRYNKYKSGRECCWQHPIDSLEVAEELLGGLTEREKSVIAHHMWPCTLTPSKYREGTILMLVDKYCAITEGLGIFNRTRVMKRAYQTGLSI